MGIHRTNSGPVQIRVLETSSGWKRGSRCWTSPPPLKDISHPVTL